MDNISDYVDSHLYEIAYYTLQFRTNEDTQHRLSVKDMRQLVETFIWDKRNLPGFSDEEVHRAIRLRHTIHSHLEETIQKKKYFQISSDWISTFSFEKASLIARFIEKDSYVIYVQVSIREYILKGVFGPSRQFRPSLYKYDTLSRLYGKQTSARVIWNFNLKKFRVIAD